MIDNGRATPAQVHLDGGTPFLPAAELERTLGWRLEPEGLCKGGVCLPNGDGLVAEAGVDLGVLCERISRPLVTDLDEKVIGIGVAVAERSASLATLEAPDFTLPDLAGKPHSLSDYRGKKVLLVAYASW